MDSVHRYYEDIASKYDQDRFQNSYGRYIDALERPILSSLLSSSGPKENLEIACGTGRFLNFAHTGVDVSKNMLKIAREKYPEAHLVNASFDAIPLEEQSFSNIYAFHLVMHLNDSKVEKLSKEAMRLLKDDGSLIIDVPSHFRRRFKSKRNDWHGSYAPPLRIFEQLGWTITKVHPVMFVPIHRIPNRFRGGFLSVEKVLSTLIPTFCASYMILEMRKTQ
ncbi:MAG: methyltransferase type 11 [Deltaproteobacteria bacterium]|nr:methyltransferase type 11 [Deltaproteobacteria bacterium]